MKNNVNKYLLIVFSLVISKAILAAGSPDGIEFYISSKSNLKEFGTIFPYHVNIDGDIKLRAKYSFVYEKNSASKRNPKLYLYPIGEEVKKLPVFKDRGNPVNIKSIYIFNPSETSYKLLKKETADKLSKGIYPYLSGEAVFIIDGLSASYECDQVGFFSKVKNTRIASTDSEKAEKLELAKNGCQ